MITYLLAIDYLSITSIKYRFDDYINIDLAHQLCRFYQFVFHFPQPYFEPSGEESVEGALQLFPVRGISPVGSNLGKLCIKTIFALLLELLAT